MRIETNEIDGQLAAHDQLFEIGLPIRRRRIRLRDHRRDPLNTDLAKVQIGREPARGVELGPIAIGRVACEAITNKRAQRCMRRARAAGKVRNRPNRSVDWKLIEQSLFSRGGFDGRRTAPLDASARIARRYEKFVEQRMDLGTDRARGEVFSAKQPAWHDRVSIDGPKRHGDFARDPFSGSLGVAERVFIADHQTWPNLRAEFHQPLVVAAPDHHTNPALGELVRQLAKSLTQELIMAQIGVMGMRQQVKKYHHRFAEQVGRFDGDIESWIIARTLRAAHPINNTVATVVRRAGTAPCYARIKLQGFEAVHVDS